MNFFRVPREHMSKEELNELIHLYKVSQASPARDQQEMADRLLQDFHARQPSNGITDQRLAELFRMSFLSLNRKEKEYVCILTRALQPK